MSAEGKKKRGESGVSNAKTNPWRYGQNKACVPAGVPRAEPRPGSAFDKPPKGLSFKEAGSAERNGR